MTYEEIQTFAIGEKVMVYHHLPIPGKEDPEVSVAEILKVHGSSIDPLIEIKWDSRKESEFIHSNQIAEVINKTSTRKMRSDKVRFIAMSMHAFLDYQQQMVRAKRAKTDNTNNNSNNNEANNHINIDEEDNHNNIDEEDNHNNIDKEDNDNNDEEDNDKNDEEDNDKNDEEDNDKNDEEDNDNNDEEDNDNNDEEENGIIMNEHNDDNNNKRNNLQLFSKKNHHQDVINVFGLQLGFKKPNGKSSDSDYE